MSSPDATPSYLISLPTGTEGPYTIDELRTHVRAGRLAPTDRVLCGTDKRSRPLLEVIPDAASLQPRTESIARRKSTESGRMTIDAAPSSRAATDSQARRYRTPLPAGATPAESPRPSHAAAPKADGKPPKKVLTAMTAGAVLVACLGAIAWQLGMFDSYANGHPGLRWRATFAGAAGGPWTLALNGLDLEIMSPTKQSTHVQVKQNFVSGGRMQLTMNPPHPELGPVITISSTKPAVVTVEKDNGSAEVLP